jgi:hypothetical protein
MKKLAAGDDLLSAGALLLNERRTFVTGPNELLSHKPSPEHLDDVCGDLVDVSGFSLRDINELDRSVLAEELRRLLDGAHDDANAVGRFKASI